MCIYIYIIPGNVGIAGQRENKRRPIISYIYEYNYFLLFLFYVQLITERAAVITRPIGSFYCARIAINRTPPPSPSPRSPIMHKEPSRYFKMPFTHGDSTANRSHKCRRDRVRKTFFFSILNANSSSDTDIHYN